ncbi:MAG: C1 family peptidase [Flavobacterium sp.]|uniref:C1 family peptidase n=1 Tax=Flavobacterium sp. TaxID=239 RepID=UPI003264A5BB
MKSKKNSLILFLFAGYFLFAQSTDRAIGSWSGKLSIPNGPTVTLLMHFKVTNELLSGTFDIPEQAVKTWSMDATVSKDSLFVDFSTRLGKGAAYKGRFAADNSMIDGKWFFGNGDSRPLTLLPTTAQYVQKSNLHPQFEGYKIVKLIKSTPTKDQQNTGTCWSHATTSFIEAEAIRLGKKPVVLSPMFFVVPTYLNKAEHYIRMQGKQVFDEGGLTFNVLKAYKEYGAIPEEIYNGKTDNSAIHDHFKMETEATSKVNHYLETGRGIMTPEEYRQSIAATVYKTIPKAPENFNYQGKNYTPKSFAKENIGINPDDYVEITSYTHHPFYSKFVLEMPSNWNNDLYLNVPLNDFETIVDEALLNNYSVCWDGDIHEGFTNGFCKLSNDTQITQQSRQAAFDNYTTQDDHNMHIIGIAEDTEGKRFYILKNSSSMSDCGGYVYMSKEYLLLKTISVMVNKEAIPKEILNKGKIKL